MSPSRAIEAGRADPAGVDARIRAAVAAIPRGRVASYGQLARLAGEPRGARRVGRVLRAAGRDARLPWHRVVAATGRVALPDGDPARVEQLRRLRAECVIVVDGRIDMARFGWRPDLDAVLWGPPAAPS